MGGGTQPSMAAWFRLRGRLRCSSTVARLADEQQPNHNSIHSVARRIVVPVAPAGPEAGFRVRGRLGWGGRRTR